MEEIKFYTKNKLIKLILSMIILDILIIIFYKIGNVLMGATYTYHSWVDVVYVAICSRILTLVVLLLRIKTNKNCWIKLVLDILLGFTIVISLFIGYFIVVFTYTPEHRDGIYIAQVNAGLGHHTRIDYYEDINIFIMKRANKESEIYDGSYDRYVK